jgi:cysteinyl-tRNA synthetase
MLVLFNTLTRRKVPFQPITPGQVDIYVCGMTVYDYCHIGHARAMIVFDMIVRWLRASGLRVRYVRNITDIDDKIIARAAQRGISIGELTTQFITAMEEDAALLGVLPPDIQPRATQHVPDMLALIAQLEQRGLAYVADNGDVCYAVRQFPAYGRLSGKSLDDLRAGERVAIDQGKRDPLDFVLWKRAHPDDPPQARWDSPWGVGRPGWHIECSAMSQAHLGTHFDIHGGGQDLQFPHHDNEIAQSVGAHEGLFVNYWLHNGFVRVDDEKMSKSLGNFLTIRDVLKAYDPEVLRFFILRAHYRSPVHYADAHVQEATQALSRLYTALRPYPDRLVPVDWSHPKAVVFREAMDDDFNVPEALAVLFDLATSINRQPDPAQADLLKGLAGILGLLTRNPDEFLQGTCGERAGQLSVSEIEALIEQRKQSRAQKDFAQADRIRDVLWAAGIVLEDRAQGASWRRSTS